MADATTTSPDRPFRTSIITVFIAVVLLVGLTLVYLSFERVSPIARCPRRDVPCDRVQQARLRVQPGGCRARCGIMQEARQTVPTRGRSGSLRLRPGLLFSKPTRVPEQPPRNSRNPALSACRGFACDHGCHAHERSLRRFAAVFCTMCSVLMPRIPHIGPSNASQLMRPVTMVREDRACRSMVLPIRLLQLGILQPHALSTDNCCRFLALQL